jgi:oxygen-dependent protoporphyrinogen oxidase
MESGAAVDLSWLEQLHYAAVTVLVLGFRREDVAHPLDGFGVLIPEKERETILGAIFSSSLFPGRAPTGHVTLTCYLGGSRAPELAVAPLEVQLKSTREALARILGVRGEPTLVHRVVHARAIPQYNREFAGLSRRMAELEKSAPGLRLVGHFRQGIALTDCLLAGLNLAEALAESLGPKSADRNPLFS